ncbi:MAG: OmpA family protein [Planctomycetota bacterium]
MGSRRSKNVLAVFVVWVLIVLVLALAYRYVVMPQFQRSSAMEQAVEQYEAMAARAVEKGLTPDALPEDASVEMIQQWTADLEERLTGSRGVGVPIEHRVKLSLDSFSGYAVLRSPKMLDALAGRGIDLKTVDDGADYIGRLQAVRSGETPMAVFTIDALLTASAQLGETPATIVMLIDETTGADAIVAYEEAVPNIDALNRADARLVATPSSPSETLGRVVMANFALPELPDEPWTAADGAGDVYQQMKGADKSKPTAYILWEPFTSRALDLPGTHVLLDSSRFRGYIVDVLVVQRRFLLDHEDVVRAVVEEYLREAHRRRVQPAGWAKLIAEDARRSGEALSKAQVERLVEGVWWKTTQENFAHLGLLRRGGGRDQLQPLGRMISNITEVLLQTGAIDADPTEGQPESLFYDGILSDLARENFHPAAIRPSPGADAEQVRQVAEAPPLDDAGWDRLSPVGTLEVADLVFARGTARLTRRSEFTLDRLIETLDTWPQYYLKVTGQARQIGDADANRALAEQRAQAAAEYLIAKGATAHRIQAQSSAELGTGGTAQTVTFTLSQTPF